MIAQMESDYQAARLLWLRAGFLKNNGRRNTRETGLAKWFATVASERAAGDAVQVHGANGYSDEYPVGRFYRNCKGAVIYEGTREIHKIMQADYVLGFRQDRPTRCELPPISMHDACDLSLEFLGVVEQAAIACAHTMGHGDGHKSDQAAVETMRQMLDRVPIDGTIVIGEGERDKAPMLFIGEKVGVGARLPDGGSGLPKVDIAVDPLEGTNLCATGAPNAMAVLAASDGGGLLHAPDLYMEKLVVGPSAKHVVRPRRSGRARISAPSRAASIATSRTSSSSCFDRPRHEQLDRGDPGHRRAHPVDQRRRSVGGHCRGSRRQRRARRDGDRRRARRRAHGGGDALPERRDLRTARRQQARARGALPRDGYQRLQTHLHVGRISRPATTSSSPRPASPTARLMKGVRFFGDGVRTRSLVMQTEPARVRFIDTIHIEPGGSVRVRF